MRKKLSLTPILLLLSIIAVFNSCKQKTAEEDNSKFAKYISAYTSGKISSSSEIQIILTEDMPSVELNKEIEGDIFKFSPEVKGHAYWSSARSIRFIPDANSLKTGTEYDGTFHLGKILDVPKEFKEFHFKFHVPDQSFSLDLLPFSPMRDNDETWNEVRGKLTLADNAFPSEVLKMFKLKANKEAKVAVNPMGSNKVYEVLIDSLRRTTKDEEYVVEVDGSSINAKKTESEKIMIPKLGGETFSVLDARLASEGQRAIRVTFSSALSANQNIHGLIQMDGVKNYSYDINKNVLNIYLENYNSATVNLKIFKELKNAQKKKLDQDYNYSLTIEAIKPAIKVYNSGTILPNSENLIIPFQAVNLAAVEVKVIKIFESNLPSFFQYNDIGESDALKRYGRLILKKTIRLDEDPTLDLSNWNNFSLDLATLIKQDPGSIYRVDFLMKKEFSLYNVAHGSTPAKVTSTENNSGEPTEEDMEEWDEVGGSYYRAYDYNWREFDWDDEDDPTTPSYYMRKYESSIVLASNIGLTAKLGDKKTIHVIANDVLTTQPLTNIPIEVLNYQLQRIGKGNTDSNGFAEIDYKGGAPFLVIANNGKERGYLKVSSNLALSLSNFDVNGKSLRKGIKGYIYGERGVWRPGDQLYLTFILEDKEKVLPKDHPVELELFNPEGQLIHRTVKTQGVDGFYPFQFSTDADAPTGMWQVRIRVGGVQFSKSLRIETIKPNRLKIRLDAGEVIDASKGTISGTLSSQWLHGAPASNLKAKVEMTLNKTYSPFKGYERYTFSDPTSNFSSQEYEIFDGVLDAKGNAEISSALPEAESAPGLLRAYITSRVFENGGDASIYTQSVSYSPYASYVGVNVPTKDDGSYWLETDTDNKVEIATVDKDGKPTSRAKVNVKIYKLEWRWWWNRGRDNLASYINSTSAKVILDKTVSTSKGKANVTFRVNYPEYGRYLALVTDEESGHKTGEIFYLDWPYERGRSRKDDASGLTMLSFTTDKQSYKVGETVTVTLPKSSNGRTLISIEQGSKILAKDWAETSAFGDTKYQFTVTEDMTPNFYISANLFQPHAQTDNELPIRLYGVLNISATDEETILKPVIEMPDVLRPETEFTINVSEQNRKGMTYTIAVVDEGLLDLTNFKTPNAWNDFYSRQALTVQMWDMYDQVIGAQTGKMGPLLSIGGDEELGGKKSPLSRFKPVVRYLGPFKLSAGEKASHKVKLPPYFGSVRTMVVAGNPKGAYGKAEKAVPVKNPLMILSTLPRVAGPEEEMLVPVNVFAMDKNVKNVTVTIQSNGKFQFIDGKTQKVTFTEVGDKTIYFKAKVSKTTGHDHIVIKAVSGGESATETIDIEIRNPNPLIVLSEKALVASGTEANLKLAMGLPQEGDWARMEVSRMPGVNLSKNLSYLMNYPHGCSEQVTSKVLPLLYVKSFRHFTPEEKEKIDYNINEGIKILMARQLSDGGFMYWPGNNYPNEWVTTYVGHFLLEAQRAGYSVPASVIKNWQRFQLKLCQNWNRQDLYNSYYTYSISDLQQAYRLYTLALSGSPDLASMNRLKESDKLSVQARWRLAATYAISGKKDAAQQLISGSTDKVQKYSFSNNTYGSASRDMAMIMETYLLLGKVEKALALAEEVSKDLSHRYVTTQTAAYGLMAMSKLAEQMGSGIIAYDWSLNGTQQKSSNQGAVFQDMIIKPQEKIDINFKNKGQGQLFVRLIGRTQPLGDNVPALQGEDTKLIVTYIDGDNKPIDVSSLKQGTEFYANVVIQNTSGTFLSDMALTQIFASGWEIFNERMYGANGSQGYFNYQDIRDDRVMTYFNLSSGNNKTIKIRLQAAYCGKFYLPGVSCETMYNPTEQTRTKGQWVEVVK